jgi:hypothetical protein
MCNFCCLQGYNAQRFASAAGMRIQPVRRPQFLQLLISIVAIAIEAHIDIFNGYQSLIDGMVN